MNTDFLQQMNTAYTDLENRALRVRKMLSERGYELEYGWFNDHYQCGAEGKWQRDAYPIPVIGVKSLCDVEMQFDRITVSSKLKRKAALAFDYALLAAYDFEVFGVEDFLLDFYRLGQSFEQMKASIAASNETDIGFAFTVEENDLIDLVRFLQGHAFFY